MGDTVKKVLYYFSWASLWLACLMTGFVSSEQQSLMECSTLAASVLLMLAYAFTNKAAWGTFTLCAMAACVQIPYLMPASELALYFLGGAAFFLVVSLGLLYWDFRMNAAPGILVEGALIAKGAVLPTVIINLLVTRQTQMHAFENFSWLLLACTSLYAVLGIVLCMKKKVFSFNTALAAALPQFCFGTDILSCLFVLWKLHRWKEPVPEVHTPIYQKAVFSRTNRKPATGKSTPKKK